MKATRCTVDGCQDAPYARAVCRSHYDALRRAGAVPTRADRDTAFRARLIPAASGCIEWSGARGRDGYGSVRVGRKTMLTHRRAWELAHGRIPDGLCVLHRCDNPPCCNPEHLFLGTPADNAADRDAKGRLYTMNVTHCPAGHLYDDGNTYRYPDGRRKCRACSRSADKARRLRAREAA